MMQQEICALCRKSADLRKSHAIPDSFFKRITKRNNGQAIAITGDQETPLSLTSNSWWEYQLCIDCEKHLNDNYERYSISAIRGHQGTITKHEIGVIFSDIDIKKLQLFFLAILWRAANSKNPAYDKIMLPNTLNILIQNHLIEKKQLPISKISIKISRLVDRTPENGFDQETLKHFLTTPFPRISIDKKICFLFIFEGFLIEFEIPGVTHKNREAKGLINPSKKKIIAPYIDIFEIPELVEILVTGLRKDTNGNSQLKK